MWEWYLLVDDLLLSAHELSFSVDKFLKYSKHVLDELRRWVPFYTKWYKWAKHVSLIWFHTQEEIPTDTTVDVDTVIDMLCEILGSDIFDMSKENYVKAYDIYTQLIPFWDKVYREKHKIARRRAIEVLSGKTYIAPSQKVTQAKDSIWIEVHETLSLFENFCDLLKVLSQNPNELYIPGYEDSIKPQFTQQIQKLMDYIDRWEKSELQICSQRNMKWTTNGDRLDELEISDWYSQLNQKDPQEILLDFGIFLFKKWELDVLPQKKLIVSDLLSLARKISKRRHIEILQLILLEQNNSSKDINK